MLQRGKPRARQLTGARVLLKTAAGYLDEDIVEALDVERATTERWRQRFVECGQACLHDQSRPGATPKLDDKGEARLIAEACSTAPQGRERWTLELLAERDVALQLIESYSHESVRQVLKKIELKPWRKKQWCLPFISSDFVAALEDLLDLYAEPYELQRPQFNFDGTNKQLIQETRPPLPPQAGPVAKYDCEYDRNGTANLFMLVETQTEAAQKTGGPPHTETRQWVEHS